MTRVSKADLARLGERLRAVREDAGLSQREVARRLGMTEVGYGHFERGRRLPSAADLPWLAAGLGVTTAELLLRLGLIDPYQLDGVLPTALAGRIQRIATHYGLLSPAEKAHLAAILGLAGDYVRSDCGTQRLRQVPAGTSDHTASDTTGTICSIAIAEIPAAVLALP